jgi:ComF family protein
MASIDRPLLRSIRERVSPHLDEFTQQWIGWTFPPVDQAIQDARWATDDAIDYCVRCGDSVGKGEATPHGCATCRVGGELAGGIANGVVRLGVYTDPMREWLHAIKYHRWTEMGERLGTMLGDRVRESGLIDIERAVVVPMPMPWQRRVYRGIDHAALVAREVARTIDAPISRALSRTMHATQVSLTPAERKRSGSRGLRVRRRIGGWSHLNGAHLVLVDDVRTTGATLKAATRFLRRLKPERIVCAVIAVSDSAARRMRKQANME